MCEDLRTVAASKRGHQTAEAARIATIYLRGLLEALRTPLGAVRRYSWGLGAVLGSIEGHLCLNFEIMLGHMLLIWRCGVSTFNQAEAQVTQVGLSLWSVVARTFSVIRSDTRHPS